MAVVFGAAGSLGACDDREATGLAEFCETSRTVGADLPFMTVDVEDPHDVAAMHEFIASWAETAPDDVARDFATLADGFVDLNRDLGNPEVSSDELHTEYAEYLPANGRVVAFVDQRCDVDLTAING